MSKIIYACRRDWTYETVQNLKRRVEHGASRIAPDSVRISPTRVMTNDGIVTAILNPSATVLTNRSSVCVGQVATDSHWNVVGGERPEGTYAICRSNGKVIELLSDAVGSRTLWYYFDASIFIASTSQRWVTAVLGSFRPSQKALTWMLTTGTLGPTESWDCRFNRLQADTTLSVDIESWTTELKHREAVFRPITDSEYDQKSAFREELRNAFRPLEFDYTKWVLPLSGGYDSRAVLCMLPHTEGLRTITWGTEASVHDSGSDAAIAIRLANSMGVEHEYFKTDSSEGSLAAVFDKFVAYGEGRIDRIAGYLDGFAIWRTLVGRGIEGVIRGDEGFGWKEVSSVTEARRSVGLLLWSDFSNLPDLESFGFDQQEIPGFLLHRDYETPSQWRDRLYHQYRAPTTLAALTDLKVSFVEVANPLLTHSIISAVRTLPDDMRTGKCLFKTIVNEISPDIPYSDTRSIVRQTSVLHSREAVTILSDLLTSDAARAIFPETLIAYVMQGLSAEPRVEQIAMTSTMKAGLRRIIPDRFRHAVRKSNRKPAMDLNEMAFRIYVVCKSYELLQADACAGQAVCAS